VYKLPENGTVVPKYHVGEERGVYRVLVGKLEGKRPPEKPRRRWVHNIRTISRRWDVGIWTGLGWFRIVTGGERL